MVCDHGMNHANFHLFHSSLWKHKEVDIASHKVAGLVLQVGNTEKFPRTLGFKSLDPFFSQHAGYMFHSHRGGRK